jgi:hypothetical protein
MSSSTTKTVAVVIQGTISARVCSIANILGMFEACKLNHRLLNSPLPCRDQEGDRCPVQQKRPQVSWPWFNASDDTVDMVQTLLTASAREQTLIRCHFADPKKGIVNFDEYMHKHNPEVVIFDLSPPYDENWRFFKTIRDAKTMEGRGMVLTTTNKNRLDEVLGEDSHVLEVVGKPKD